MDESAVVAYRSVIAFLTLFIYSRVLGKQQISQLSLFEYVTGITIGSIAARMSVSLTSSAMPHMVGLTVWFLLTFVFQLVVMKSARLGTLLRGSPVAIMQNGKILENNMATIRYPLGDLLLQLRSRQVFDVSQVENAILEPNGTLSVQLKSQYRPLTPNDLGIPTPYEGLTHEVVQEGKLDTNKLEEYNISPDWVLEQLKSQGIEDVRTVFLAALNTQGRLFVTPYQNRPTPGDDSTQNKKEIQH